MKFVNLVLLFVLLQNDVFSQIPKETTILEASIKVIQNGKKGGGDGGNYYRRMSTLKSIVSDLKDHARSRTLERGVLEHPFLTDSNSLIEIKMKTIFSQRVVNLMLSTLQLEFNFTLNTVKIDTMAWFISSPNPLTNIDFHELDHVGFAELSEYSGFMEDIIVLDSSVDGRIQVSGDDYEMSTVFAYLRKKYGFDIVKKKCTVDFLVIQYHKHGKNNRKNFFNKQE